MIWGWEGAGLQYRKGGESSYTLVEMSAQVNQFTGTIPGIEVTSRGIEYYIFASDGMHVSYDPPLNWQASSHAVRVRVSNLVATESPTGGSDQTAYRMISVPVELDNPTADDVLVDDLGTYDDTEWRFQEYKNGDWVEYPHTGGFAPGKAFWLIVRELGKQIDAGAGMSVSTEDSFPITLNPGWNDIGLPFNFSASWSDVDVDSSKINGPYLYERFWDIPSTITQLDPWKGYAIKNLSGSDVVLTIPSRSGAGASLGSPKTTSGFMEDLAIQWYIRIIASCEEAMDPYNYLGCSGAALEARDALDLSEPPPVGSYVSVYFPHLEWSASPDRLTTDFRPPSSGGAMWEFVVETNITSSLVTLRFEHAESIPGSSEAVILDSSGKLCLDLRYKKEYRFDCEKKKSFLLLVGSEDYINREKHELAAGAYVLYQNYPNPFDDTTILSFAVPVQAKCSLSLFNLSGEMVRKIAECEYPAGRHEVAMPAGGLPAGVYLCRMEAHEFAGTRKIILLK